MLAVAAVASPAFAQAPPWIARSDIPLPSGARSVEFAAADEPLFVRPEPDSPRRGTAALGARLPIFAAVRGAGCAGRWLMVGALAWVCESRVQWSRAPALEASGPAHYPSEGLPHRYYFVGTAGSLGYRSLELAEDGVPDAELEPGFAVATVAVASPSPSDPFALTTHGYWLPLRDLVPAPASAFRGRELGPNETIGWVYTRAARASAEPDARARRSGSYPRLEALPVLQTVSKGARRWFRVGDNAWLSDRDLRVASEAGAPDGIGPGERWIDVDTEQQVLTAYEGTRAVFATLVSTGKGLGASVQATPKGLHRIWVKLRSTDMDNLEDEEAERYYAMQSVPWVMFFQKGYGLHGTYWHASFGTRRSHGCVNLSPRDAARLFAWTSPRLPAGWTAVFPTEYELGTLIRVR